MNDIFKEIDDLQKEILQKGPFSVEELKQIKEYYRIGLTYSSNALEGNSLTESETKVVLEEGITIGGKPLKDHYEAQGHSDAYDFLYELVKKDEFSEHDVLHLHKLFYQKIDPKKAGVYRKQKVFLSGSKYKLPLPEDLTCLMVQFFKHSKEYFERGMHPVKIAALVHKDFVFVHPFIDGNGRVACLLMNIVLQKKGFPIAVIPPVLRSQYIQALEKAHENDEDFILFIAQVVKESQRDFIRLFS